MNWLSNLTSIVRSKIGPAGPPVIIKPGPSGTPVVAPITPTVTQQQPVISPTIQFYDLVEAGKLLNYEFKNLDVPLIKKGCEIIKAPYIGGGTFWVKRTNDGYEVEALKAAISKEIWKGTPAIVVYFNLNRDHPRYSYYQAIAIRSSDLLDLKKAMKIHKLKAFL